MSFFHTESIKSNAKSSGILLHEVGTNKLLYVLQFVIKTKGENEHCV
jgi:hypothetical protein